ncbi:hypothetical protein M5J07_21005 [Achromobacter mucicolens]|uniref:hypothetical protein n=1 Tax=Achromobacter mucicolens TaxID=1389922 RepID=UPI0020A52BDD|nr:hypothetical protein [Achromobacter mucicolens]MCP2517431.1 hypothetical protein [Achromobacter mucicolens]
MEDGSIISTQDQRKLAVVLLHPNHAGPAVVNPKIRGPKKGCVNFLKWKRERDYRRFAAQEAELQAYREAKSRGTA